MRSHKLISTFLHPVVMPTVGVLLYFIFSDFRFSKQQKLTLLGIIFTATYVIPIILLIVLKAIGSIKNYKVETIEERKIPLIFMIVLFFFIGKTLNQTHVTREISFLFYGTSIGLCLAYLIFITKIKTSLHLLSMGSAVGFFLLFQQIHTANILPLIIILIILSGTLASSRLYLKAHTPKEVYLGFFTGVVCQFLAFFIF